jgi:hypothetical protein
MAKRVSTRDLSLLPDVETVRRTSQTLAALDAILSPDWEYRYFSFNSRWDAKKREMMASMRNGSGDEYFILFTRDGAIMKGFAHESPASRNAADSGKSSPGLFDGVPEQFAAFLNEPAFVIEDTTFCIWRRYGDAGWQTGNAKQTKGTDPDGSAMLLAPLCWTSRDYAAWASHYYGDRVDANAVDPVFRLEPIDAKIAKRINANVSPRSLAKDLSEIGYPRR